MDTIETMRPVLKSQYHACLAMLRDTIERCPDELWTSRDYRNPFWRIAYHVLYYTDFYLQPNADSFRPWDHHQTGIQFMDDQERPAATSKYWRTTAPSAQDRETIHKGRSAGVLEHLR